MHDTHNGSNRFLHDSHMSDACHFCRLFRCLILHLIECRRNRNNSIAIFRLRDIFWQTTEQLLQNLSAALLRCPDFICKFDFCARPHKAFKLLRHTIFISLTSLRFISFISNELPSFFINENAGWCHIRLILRFPDTRLFTIKCHNRTVGCS